MDFKEKVFTWVMNKFSFVNLLFSFLLGTILAIFEYPYLAPLDDQPILLLIALNTMMMFLIIYLIKNHFKGDKK